METINKRTPIEHPPRRLLQLNKSARSFIIQGRETVARLNSLGFSTSGEERLVIGTRRTETKRNCLKCPTTWFADRHASISGRGVCQVLCSTRGLGGLLASGTRFFPSPTSINQCLLHLSMSGTSILAGAHSPVMSGGIINAAGTVREAVQLWNELTVWISCRSITIISLATKRYPMP